MERLIKTIFSLSRNIRYVAIYNDGKLITSSRSGTAGASSSESDKYEELIVNPTLLTLVTQRGNIDCGGVRFVLIRYGNFFQIVIPTAKGHISICVEPHANPLRLIEPVSNVLNSNDANLSKDEQSE